MTLSVKIHPPSSSRVYLGNTYPPLLDPITINYGDRRLLKASNAIGRRYDLFTNDSAVANFSKHVFMVHNEDNWFGEDTTFPSGYKNARVDVEFNNRMIWQGIVLNAVVNREKQTVEIHSEDILSRVLRLPFGILSDEEQQSYEYDGRPLAFQEVYQNLHVALQITLGFVSPGFTQRRDTSSIGGTLAGRSDNFLSRQNPFRFPGLTSHQKALMFSPESSDGDVNQPARLELEVNEATTFRQRLLPLLSALGLALVPDYTNPGKLLLFPAKRGGRDTSDPSRGDLRHSDYPLLTDEDVKAGTYREIPAEDQVINALRVKVAGLDEEVFYRGDTRSGSRASVSRIIYGQRIPPVFDLTLLANAATLKYVDEDGEDVPAGMEDDDSELVFDSFSNEVKAWLDFVLETRAFGARRCEFCVGLERLEQVIDNTPEPADGTVWQLPLLPFRNAFVLDLWFNNLSTPPVRGWWYVIGTALNYHKNELKIYLEEGERNGWSYVTGNLARPDTDLSGPTL